jgi:phage-related protein
MKSNFEIIFLEQALEFIDSLDKKSRIKVIYNIDKAKLKTDPKLFKKLDNDIWEFRTVFKGLQYRLLAFWDKIDNTETLVLATHGFIKKVNKVPKKEIEKAKRIRTAYFEQKE